MVVPISTRMMVPRFFGAWKWKIGTCASRKFQCGSLYSIQTNKSYSTAGNTKMASQESFTIPSVIKVPLQPLEDPLQQLGDLSKRYKVNLYKESFALEMDRHDELRSFREKFHIPPKPDISGEENKDMIYLCGNSLGLSPKDARKRVNEEMKKWETIGVEGWFTKKRPWVTLDDELSELAAPIVGANSDEVAIMNSLTLNLHMMLIGFYRPKGKRHKILVEGGAFCSDQHVVKSHILLHGNKVETSLITINPKPGEHHLNTEDVLQLIEEEGESISVIMLGAVQYYTGQFFDIPAITAAGQKKGCIVGFDCAHAIGNVPLQLHDWNVDWAAWCSYKYLNAGPGAVAGIFVHQKHGQKSLLELPRLCGWWGQEPSDRFNMDGEWRMKSGAASFQNSTPGIFNLIGLESSLKLFTQAGMSRIRTKSILLTAYLQALLEHELAFVQLKILTPRDPSQRGAQLSCFLMAQHSAKQIVKQLSDAGVTADVREPNVLRVAPAPLYNTFHDVFQFVHILKRVLMTTDQA